MSSPNENAYFMFWFELVQFLFLLLFLSIFIYKPYQFLDEIAMNNNDNEMFLLELKMYN